MSYARPGQILASDALITAVGEATIVIGADKVVIPAKGTASGVRVCEVAPRGGGLLGVRPVRRQIDWERDGEKLSKLKELHDLANDWLGWTRRLERSSTAILNKLEETKTISIRLEDAGVGAQSERVKKYLPHLQEDGERNSPNVALRLIEELKQKGVAPEEEQKKQFDRLERALGSFRQYEGRLGDSVGGLDGLVNIENTGPQLHAMANLAVTMGDCVRPLLAYADDAIREVLGLGKSSRTD